MSIYNWLSIIVPFAALSFYFVKRWLQHHIEHSVKHHYERELETHKANLQRDYDVQLERLKAELAEKQFRFSHVFEKTAEAIVMIHRKLLTVNRNTERIFEQSKANAPLKFDEVLPAFQDLKSFYEDNKMYVPKVTQRMIKDVMMAHVEAVIATDSDKAEVEKLSKDVRSLLEQLENDFQRILGFPTEPSAPEKK